MKAYYKEIKFIIPTKKKETVIDCISEAAYFDPHADENGYYNIKTSYIAYAKNESQTFKYRFRQYSQKIKPETIYFEVKMKNRNLVRKERRLIDKIPQSIPSLGSYMQQISFDKKYLAEPVYLSDICIVYNRQAFIVGEAIPYRITFDHDIKMAGTLDTLLHNDYCIMEIKGNTIHKKLAETLQVNGIIAQAVSKFQLAYHKHKYHSIVKMEL